jgi:hypothetical protein
VRKQQEELQAMEVTGAALQANAHNRDELLRVGHALDGPRRAVTLLAINGRFGCCGLFPIHHRFAAVDCHEPPTKMRDSRGANVRSLTVSDDTGDAFYS